MIFILIAILIALFIVIKFCKKTLKIVLSIILTLIAIYGIIIGIDLKQVQNLKEPIIAHSSEMKEYENYSKETFKGIGYKIEVKKIENNKIIATTMYIFNMFVAGAIE